MLTLLHLPQFLPLGFIIMKIQLNQGHWVAIALFVGLSLWMLIGAIGSDDAFDNPRPLALDTGLFRVQAEHLSGELIQREVNFSGYTAANRRVEIRSEISGKVIAVHKAKGSNVKKGEIILELDSRDLPARVKQAQANLRQRQMEAQGAKELANKGLANESQTVQAETLLANAEADYTLAKIQLDNTKIRAPFDGIVDQRMVEVGDFIRDNTAVAVMLDFSPWLVKGQIPEREAANVSIGDAAWASLVNGDIIEGKIRFIASEANPQTRTFAVEMEATSKSSNMSSGITARINVPQPPTYAYYLSPALLVLDDQGKLGLKGIDKDNKVYFVPVNLLKADDKGIWVYGPEIGTSIITVGQGFVEIGQKVAPVYTSLEEPSENQFKNNTLTAE